MSMIHHYIYIFSLLVKAISAFNISKFMEAEIIDRAHADENGYHISCIAR